MGKKKPNMSRKFRQGQFKPKFPDKYIGDVDNIYFRSSWELKFMNWADSKKEVTAWGSEIITIPYQIQENKDGQLITKERKYYPDFYLEIGDKRYVIEVKPIAQTQPPKKPKKESVKSLNNYYRAIKAYKKNLHKWKFAKEWCERQNIEFQLVTEKNLYKYK